MTDHAALAPTFNNDGEIFSCSRTFATKRAELHTHRRRSTLVRNMMEAVCRAVREERSCIIEDVFGVATMEQIERELSSHVALRLGDALGMCEEHAAFTGKSTIRMLGVLHKSAALAQLAEEPLVLDVVETLLEPYCEWTQLHIGLFRRLQPGDKAQPVHQDRHSTLALRVLDAPSPGSKDYLPGAQWGVAALWALTDCTEHNGATRVVPRSHLRENINLDPSSHKTTLTACEDLERQTIKVTMRRGSVLLYPSATVHDAGAHDTDKNRGICLFAYSPAWVREHALDAPRRESQSPLSAAPGSYCLLAARARPRYG